MSLLPARGPAAKAFQRAPSPAADTPWRQARWCVIDLELTGLGKDGEIIAIGAVPVHGGRIALGEALYTLVRPSRAPRADAVIVHKLRFADLAEAPPLDDAIDGLLKQLAGSVPVFHTAAVERAFLGRELRHRRVRLPPSADTEVLGRLWLRHRDGTDPRALRLTRLGGELRQPGHRPHHALGDALTTAQAFIALATHLDCVQEQTVSLLTTAGERLAGPRRFGAS